DNLQRASRLFARHGASSLSADVACTPGALLEELVFFFSSRRRHTRSKRDWSSDVCSSDLCEHALVSAQVAGSAVIPASMLRPPRSEERRVGKGCRTWWMPSHRKKNPRSKKISSRPTRLSSSVIGIHD